VYGGAEQAVGRGGHTNSQGLLVARHERHGLRVSRRPHRPGVNQKSGCFPGLVFPYLTTRKNLAARCLDVTFESAILKDREWKHRGRGT
jgi:hypothetical protein